LIAFFTLNLVAIYSAQSLKCTICQLIVSYTEKLIQRNESEKFIIDELDMLCGRLPIGGPECDQIVAQYVPQLITWIVKKEPPQAFCAHVNLCASNKGQTHVHEKAHKQHKKREDQQTIPCSICQIAVGYVETWVAENATEQVIIQRLNAICSDLGPLQPECSSFVAIYVPKLIAWIENNQDPDTFCKEVRLCTSQNIIKEKKVKREEFQDKCQICQLLVTYVDQLVSQKNTIAEIESKVDEVCNMVRDPFSSVCKSFVASYLPSLINWVIKEENPQAFCSQVRMC